MRRKLLQRAGAMSPLVRQILANVTESFAKVRHLQRRHDLLFGCRRSADYAVRRQFHETVNDLESARNQLSKYTVELEDLGVRVLDPIHGTAGFPFSLPSKEEDRPRQAYFLLKLADAPEKKVYQWRIEGEGIDRPIPIQWSGTPTEPAAAVADEVENATDA